MVNELNIKNSFRSVKADILRLHGELLNIRQEQVKILVELEKMTSKTKGVAKKKPAKKKK